MLLSLHQARISSEEISIKGRMILSLTGGIAQAPLSPVPLASLNKRVSALSVKLWAVAILSQGIVLKKSFFYKKSVTQRFFTTYAVFYMSGTKVQIILVFN